jgi:5-methylthioadenosine/S-adenosylhomocysteine deaminase
MPILLRNATVVAMDAAHGAEPFRADILVDGTKIEAVGPDLEAPAGTDVIDCSERLVMPGMVNAHLHSVETPFKGRYDGMPLEIWMLYCYPILGLFDLPERMVYLRTMVVALESLRNGVTCVLDDIAQQGISGMAQVFAAYDDSGMRASVSDNMRNRYFTETLPFVRDLLPAELLTEELKAPPPTTEDYLELCREAIRRFDDPGGRLRYVIAPSAPQRCTTELLTASMELAEQHDTSYHIHVLETKTQAVTGQEHYQRTLVRYLHDIDALHRRTTLAHGIWLTAGDIELLADAGASVAHNPISNQKLGAGIAPFRQLLDAGVNLGLGTDGICSNDSARMFDVMKAGSLLHHVTSPDHTTWPTASELLHAATVGGARSANLEATVGSITPGLEADLVVLDLRTVAFTPRNDLRNHLVYCENGASIDYVMVAGRIVVDHGRVTTVDEDALLAEFRGYMPEFLRQWELVEQLNRRFEPYVQAMHDTCAQRPLGFSRYSGDPRTWEKP